MKPMNETTWRATGRADSQTGKARAGREDGR
jgi:hypothetical protein